MGPDSGMEGEQHRVTKGGAGGAAVTERASAVPHVPRATVREATGTGDELVQPLVDMSCVNGGTSPPDDSKAEPAGSREHRLREGGGSGGGDDTGSGGSSPSEAAHVFNSSAAREDAAARGGEWDAAESGHAASSKPVEGDAPGGSAASDGAGESCEGDGGGSVAAAESGAGPPNSDDAVAHAGMRPASDAGAALGPSGADTSADGRTDADLFASMANSSAADGDVGGASGDVVGNDGAVGAGAGAGAGRDGAGDGGDGGEFGVPAMAAPAPRAPKRDRSGGMVPGGQNSSVRSYGGASGSVGSPRSSSGRGGHPFAKRSRKVVRLSMIDAHLAKLRAALADLREAKAVGSGVSSNVVSSLSQSRDRADDVDPDAELRRHFTKRLEERRQRRRTIQNMRKAVLEGSLAIDVGDAPAAQLGPASEEMAAKGLLPDELAAGIQDSRDIEAARGALPTKLIAQHVVGLLAKHSRSYDDLRNGTEESIVSSGEEAKVAAVAVADRFDAVVATLRAAGAVGMRGVVADVAEVSDGDEAGIEPQSKRSRTETSGGESANIQAENPGQREADSAASSTTRRQGAGAGAGVGGDVDSNGAEGGEAVVDVASKSTAVASGPEVYLISREPLESRPSEQTLRRAAELSRIHEREKALRAREQELLDTIKRRAVELPGSLTCAELAKPASAMTAPPRTSMPVSARSSAHSRPRGIKAKGHRGAAEFESLYDAVRPRHRLEVKPHEGITLYYDEMISRPVDWQLIQDRFEILRVDKSPRDDSLRSPGASPRSSPRGSPQASPRGSPRGSPKPLGLGPPMVSAFTSESRASMPSSPGWNHSVNGKQPAARSLSGGGTKQSRDAPAASPTSSEASGASLPHIRVPRGGSMAFAAGGLTPVVWERDVSCPRFRDIGYSGANDNPFSLPEEYIRRPASPPKPAKQAKAASVAASKNTTVGKSAPISGTSGVAPPAAAAGDAAVVAQGPETVTSESGMSGPAFLQVPKKARPQAEPREPCSDDDTDDECIRRRHAAMDKILSQRMAKARKKWMSKTQSRPPPKPRAPLPAQKRVKKQTTGGRAAAAKARAPAAHAHSAEAADAALPAAPEKLAPSTKPVDIDDKPPRGGQNGGQPTQPVLPHTAPGRLASSGAVEVTVSSTALETPTGKLMGKMSSRTVELTVAGRTASEAEAAAALLGL